MTIAADAPDAGAPATVDLARLGLGDVIAEQTLEIDRDTLVRYAGASGDFNPIHYNDAFATSVGLDGVIAHGMLTMGTAISVVLAAIGDPAAVLAYSTRFTRPVPVPALGSTALHVTATVAAIDEEARTARVDLVAEAAGAKVLGRARVTLALPPIPGEGAAA
ncbi:MaoC/PaaZ C-terminal domain-containing protein [Brachybacterium sp. AOP25-B2-12]|uniref:MaoC/PaaZ C-terminal domain-containing protein n=1 Tax=Brachybacterium sp. AOP25-B2-12 TaxID=3457710 RepID=UPI0040341E03